MPDRSEKQILARAYVLWQQAGEPHGKDEEFYYQAQRDLEGSKERGDPVCYSRGRGQTAPCSGSPAG